MSDSIVPLGPAGESLEPAALLAAAGIAPGAVAATADGGPRVMAVMVGSADGRAVVDGHAAGLSSTADRSQYRSLRAAAEACLVGPTTLLVESYSTLLDPHQREQREALGLPPEPLLATISRHLDGRLTELEIFNTPGRPVRVYTESSDELAPCESDVEIVRLAAGELTPKACIDDLHGIGIGAILCEGGPTLLGAMFEAGLVDDLFLTISPLLVGGEGARVVEAKVFEPPVAMALLSVARAGDHIFLHYALAA